MRILLVAAALALAACPAVRTHRTLIVRAAGTAGWTALRGEAAIVAQGALARPRTTTLQIGRAIDDREDAGLRELDVSLEGAACEVSEEPRCRQGRCYAELARVRPGLCVLRLSGRGDGAPEIDACWASIVREVGAGPGATTAQADVDAELDAALRECRFAD